MAATSSEFKEEVVSLGSKYIYVHEKGGKEATSPNCLVVDLSVAASEAKLMTGDAEQCKCGAILNSYSKVEEGKWTCMFCSNETEVDLAPEEIPKSADVAFVLSGVPLQASSSAAKKTVSNVVYCIDRSGSMWATEEMEGKQPIGHYDARSGVTHVSRLESMQTGIVKGITALEEDIVVGLVTFSDAVELIGDGTDDMQIVAGDTLNNFEKLKELQLKVKMDEPISEVRQQMVHRVQKIEAMGKTCLGPAMQLSIRLASSRSGSRVILATDGLSNVGLGALETGDEFDSSAEEAVKYYENLAADAKSNGVQVNILSIKGTTVNMSTIGKVASETGGNVEILSIEELQKLSGVSNQKVLATKAKVCVILPTCLREMDCSAAEAEIGNITGVSTFTLGFLRQPAVKFAKNAIPKELPIQVHLTYETPGTDLTLLRVFTYKFPTTNLIATACNAVDVPALSTFVSQYCAALAKEGLFDSARRHAEKYVLLLTRHRQHIPPQQEAFVEQFMDEFRHQTSGLQNQMKFEASRGFSSLDEMDGGHRAQRQWIIADGHAESLHKASYATKNACIIS